MKTQFLFPNRFKKNGWILFVVSVILTIVNNLSAFELDPYFNIKIFKIYHDELLSKPGFFILIEEDVSDEIILTLLIIGGVLVGFSKVKTEDELIAKIRYESLV